METMDNFTLNKKFQPLLITEILVLWFNVDRNFIQFVCTVIHDFYALINCHFVFPVCTGR